MKKKIMDILKNLPLSRKMLIIYISCVIIPVTILSMFYYHISKTGIQNREINDLETVVEKSGNSVQALMDRAAFVADMILYDDDIYQILSMTDNSGKSFIKASEMLDSKAVNYIESSSFENVIIYTDNPYLYRSRVHRRISELEDDIGQLDKNELRNGKYKFFDVMNEHTKQRSIAFLSMLRKTRASETNILRIDIPVSMISEELSKSVLISSVYLLDENDCTIAAGTREGDTESLSAGERFETSRENVLCRELDYPPGYKVAARYQPEQSGYVFGTQTIKFIVVVLLILLISTLIIFLVTESLTNKLNVLTECTRKMCEGVFETVDENSAGEDEIGLLFRGINAAIRKIYSLINEVYKERIKNAEAEKARYQTELSALQAQVNPHFMFNVLEVVRMKVIKRGDKELASVIKEISKIFRMLITQKCDIITLKEEMQFVESFINIQPYSIDDDEMDISVSAEEAALECLIPKMCVQVFVENAFLHGLENKSEDRRFSLDARISGGRLLIEIYDNGYGMDEKTLAWVNGAETADKGKDEGKKPGTGIRNVFSRLNYFFDGDYKADISSGESEGTRIKLSLPIKYE